MLEGFLLQPAFVAVRFRKWDDVRKMPDPGAKLPLLRAGWLWARAMAAAGSGEVKKAETERAAFAAARAAVPEKSMAGPQNSAAAVLEVAANVLDARIAEAKGESSAAIASWRKAVEAEDRLAYDEPPALVLPDARVPGRRAPARRPGGRGRGGLPRGPRTAIRATAARSSASSKSLEAQKKNADAAFARAQFDTAWKDADTPVRLEDL